MLMATHLIGFGARRASSAGRTLGSLITPGSTKLGTASLSNVAGAFDGTTNKAGASCTAGNGTANGWAGYTLTTSKRVYQCIFYGANNQGYTNTSATVTLSFYGKTGTAPSSATDGTLLGTTGSFSDVSSTNAKTIISTDQETIWDHVWGLDADAAGDQRIAQIEFYEAV